MKKIMFGLIAALTLMLGLAVSPPSAPAATVVVTTEGQDWINHSYQWSWNPAYYQNLFTVYAPSFAAYKTNHYKIRMDDGDYHLFHVNTSSITPVADLNCAGAISPTFKAATVDGIDLFVTEVAPRLTPPPVIRR